jgi:hypothetical protein
LARARARGFRSFFCCATIFLSEVGLERELVIRRFAALRAIHDASFLVVANAFLKETEYRMPVKKKKRRTTQIVKLRRRRRRRRRAREREFFMRVTLFFLEVQSIPSNRMDSLHYKLDKNNQQKKKKKEKRKKEFQFRLKLLLG